VGQQRTTQIGKEKKWISTNRIGRFSVASIALLWRGSASRVLEEVRKTAACETDYHDCYRKVYELILNHDKRMAAAFDNPRRSNAFLLLANMIGEELLTADELKQFSHEAQAQIKMISESVGPS
jgi:hypothetical protein